jgi:hypothetical protein
MNQLKIVRQHSLAREKFVSNGTQKDVHVVVKNSPFFIDIGLNEWHTGISNFSSIAIVAKLMFDTDEEREVVFIKRKPLEFKAQLSDDGKLMTCEIRLKVLSSQLEDMHFRVHFTAVWKESRQVIEGLTALSEPIKVVSKPEQVEKIQRGETGLAKGPARPRKRKQSDYNEALMRIEKEQRAQRELLKRLCVRDGEPSTPLPSGEMTLSSAFDQLVACYKALAPEERPMKIRKVISNTPVRDVSSINEMFDHFQYELRRDEDDGSSFAASAALASSPDASSFDYSASGLADAIDNFDLSLFAKEYHPYEPHVHQTL